MKRRIVFSLASVDEAGSAIALAKAAKVLPDDIALVARSDIELHPLIKDRVEATTDTVPAALRGMAIGGSLGIVAGLVAIALPAVGITVAGVGLMAAVGAAVGGWSSALVGSALPNDVRRTFEQEIEQGRILLVLDCDATIVADVRATLQEHGYIALPFEEFSAVE